MVGRSGVTIEVGLVYGYVMQPDMGVLSMVRQWPSFWFVE